MEIESPAFVHEQIIPDRYTCKGANVSPPLVFKVIPMTAKSLVLIVDDPDAPGGVFDHWLIWNIPSATETLPEGASFPNQGTNGFGKALYNGPCPPPGKTHHYHFKLYALDTLLDLKAGSSKAQLQKAMQGHILDEAELIGIFKR